MIKKALKYLYQFLNNSLSFLDFMTRVIFSGNYFRDLSKSDINTAVVLANGPSLEEELPKLTTAEEFEGVEFIVLNYFAKQEVFFQIKPKHYCFADPMFFEPTHRKTEAKDLFYILQNRVDWKMNIYIPHNRFKGFKKFSNLNNKYIRIIKMNTTEYSGFDAFRNYFYKLGLSMPMPGTVANLAIFVALNKNFKNIRLYGVDHTFFDSLYVNENNQICNKTTHFYAKDTSELKPILRVDNGENYKMSDYLHSIMIMFRSHDYLSNYAKYLNSNILNCTKGSMIDSYKRKK